MDNNYRPRRKIEELSYEEKCFVKWIKTPLECSEQEFRIAMGVTDIASRRLPLQ